MSLDLKKKYTFEEQCIPFLKDKIRILLAEQDFEIEKKGNAEIMGFLLRKVAAKGFIRTHAFFMNWLRELFEFGQLERKTLQEITEELPWAWDKTKQYLDAWVENGLLSYARDRRGRKTCQLMFEHSSGQLATKQPPQLRHVLSFLTHRTTVPFDQFQALHQQYRSYYQKEVACLKLQKKIEQIQKQVRAASEEEQAAFVERLVAAYLNLEEQEELDPQKRIEEVLVKESFMCKLLKKEEG